MKRLFSVLVLLFAGLSHAQSVNWDAAFATCSQEAAAFDRWAVENYAIWRDQGTATWRHVRRDEYTSSTIDVTALRQAIQANRSILSRGANPQVALNVCVQEAALNQVQSGSTQTAQRSPAAVPVARQEPDGEDSMQCVQGILSESVLYNGCRKGVNLVWCAIPGNGKTPNVNCESQELSAADLGPGSRVSVEQNFQIAWTMCDAPKHPVNVTYAPGRGLAGKCRR